LAAILVQSCCRRQQGDLIWHVRIAAGQGIESKRSALVMRSTTFVQQGTPAFISTDIYTATELVKYV
jgi:hypothetical protein